MERFKTAWFKRCAIAGLCLAAAAASPAAAHEVEAAGLKIVHPWTLEPQQGATTVVVSMTIHNTGAEAERLVSAASAFAKAADLRDGATEAAPVSPVEIPAGGTLKLKASGVHVRLTDVTEPLAGYETFPLSLTFEKAGKVDIQVMVEERN